MATVQPIKNIEDIERIKKSLHGRDRLLFVFGINSNLRISDILTLKVGDVRNKTHLTIKEDKTEKTKTFKFNKAIQDAVHELITTCQVDDQDWLFPSKRNRNNPLDRIQAYKILKNASDKVGLNINFGTHTMRKTWAYHRYINGASLPELMKALNHSSQRETLRYIGIEQEEMDNLFDSVNL